MRSTFVSLARSPQRLTRRLLVCLCALLPFAFALPAGAVSEISAITGQKKSFAYSWQEELKQGAEADKEITEEMGLYENPELQQYVDTIGQRVLQASNFTGPTSPEIYRNTKFTFRIIDSPVVNAFALPGGYIYVTRGLLAHVQNEAQLAVILGHEIAHVAARHSSQQARRTQWSQIGVIAGAILGQKVLGEKAENIGSTILNVGGQATQAFMLRYSREAEHESDTLGITYASRAGYAAAESSKFFESLQRISAAEGKSLPTWQSTHPDAGDRAQRVVQLAAISQRLLAGAVPIVGEEEYLRRIEGIVIGEDPREGFAQSGIFYHPTLRFQMPVAPGWKLENQRSQVVFAEPGGRGMMGLRLTGAQRARDAAYQFVQQSKVQVVANGDTTINGLPATVIIGQKETEEKGTLGVWDAFIEMDGKVYSLLGYAPQQSFEQMRPTFESVAAGFSPLRNNQALNIAPTVLKIVRADQSAPFATFIPTSLPQDVSAESIATMNQIRLNEAVPAGRPLKVPDHSAQTIATINEPARYPDYTQQGRPSTYPPQPQSTYPSSRYPQSSSYPDQSRNPRTSSGYPPSNYPSQTHPQQSYPPQSYPTQSSGYPQQSYPPSTNYPQANYPTSNYPSSSNPPGYPQTGYPASASGYPNPSQPTTNPYPQTQPSYPQSQQSYPQFPQPPPAQQQPRYPQSQPPPPDWPR